MTPPADPERYKTPRFPGEIISPGVWLYYRFPLSYRDVQELLFERGITVTHEAIRQWCRKFGQDYANQSPQLSPTGCPEALAPETPAPQPSALLRRRSRLPQTHTTPCDAPLWMPPAPRARSRGRRRAAGRHGRQGRLYFLFVPG